MNPYARDQLLKQWGISGRRELGPRSRMLALIVIAISVKGVVAGITILFLGARAIMATGTGFVAVGGPYEIANPAPDWVWLIPISILAGFAFGGLNVWMASRVGMVNAIAFVWPGLFLSLGWNFLEFGLHAPGGGVAIAWLVCAVVFIPMGLAPLTVIVPFLRAAWRAGRGADTDRYHAEQLHVLDGWLAQLVANLIGIAGGVVAGVVLFGAVAG